MKNDIGTGVEFMFFLTTAFQTSALSYDYISYIITAWLRLNIRVLKQLLNMVAYSEL